MTNTTAGEAINDEMIYTVAEAIMISFYINMCFFVCEIAMLSFGPGGEVRHVLDTMAHILAGPIAFLGFLNGGFMSSLFFFLSLWHFMCDSGQSRPSYIRVLPLNREEFWIWFESTWLFLHHWYIGAFKLLSTDLADQLTGINLQSGSIRFLIRTWVLGATLSHLSFGMAALHMRHHEVLRALSVLFRMGAATAIVGGVSNPATQVRLAYAWDLVWMAVILSLTARKALCTRATVTSKHGPESGNAAISGDGPEQPGDAAHQAHPSMTDSELAMHQRLVGRVRAQQPNSRKEGLIEIGVARSL